MKTMIMALSLLATFQLAHADQAQPGTPLEHELAKIAFGGGMPAPGGLGMRYVTVYTNGQVNVDELYQPKSFEGNQPREEEHFSIPSLSAADLQALNAAVAQLKGGKLTEPQGPMCYDAPSTTYSVQKGLTPEIVIFRNAGCRDTELVDSKQRPAALTVKNILDTLESEAQAASPHFHN